MGVGSETAVSDSWVRAQLLATTSVTDIVGTGANARIFLDVAPASFQSNPEYPFIVYQVQSAIDYRVVGTYRVWADTLYIVKGINAGADFGTLAPLAEAIDEALTSDSGGAVSSPAGEVFMCVREETFRLSETEEGKTFRHLGGLYRLYARGT